MENLTTFKQISGTPDELVNQSVGLSGADELLKKMNSKRTKKAVDVLLPTSCNGGSGKGCRQCFFTEDQEGKRLNNIYLTNKLIKTIKDFVNNQDKEKIALTIYPREITTTLPLLDIYKDLGIQKALTNAILLTKKENIKVLVDKGIKKISVSLLGSPNQQAYLGNCSLDVYNKIIEGIKNAIDAGIEVSIFTVVYKGNIESLAEIFEVIYNLGVRSCQIIRLIPTGKAISLPDSDFITTQEDVVKVLSIVDKSRKTYPALKISLSKFGPNFYSKGIYRYLLNSDAWPYSKYYCPWVDNSFIGVILGSNRVTPCFQAMAFPEVDIGVFKNKEFQIQKSNLKSTLLKKNLRGICSKRKCKFQSLYLGACRISAYSFAKRKGEKNPLFAGQDICITNILSKC